MASNISSTANQDHALQVIKKYRTYVEMIAEVNIRKHEQFFVALTYN